MRSLLKIKIMFTLMAGVALSLHRSPHQYFKIIGDIPKEWRKMKRRYLLDCIREFYRDKLVDFKENSEGVCRVVLTEKGKKKMLSFEIDNMTIKTPISWDSKWRMVIFDIPENKREARYALHKKLLDLGFYNLQKSIFIHPFSCLSEIEFLVELFQIRPYVRYAEVTKITNDSELKLHFKSILKL